jgi:hypothetical protein
MEFFFLISGNVVMWGLPVSLWCSDAVVAVWVVKGYYDVRDVEYIRRGCWKRL